MAQPYFSLEEAADKLGISPSDFKKRLRTEWTHIRPLQDGSTQRFKSKDVEELARQIGFGSEEELQLVDPSSDELALPPVVNRKPGDTPKPGKSQSGKTKSGVSPKKTVDEAESTPSDDELNLGDKEIFLLADETPAKRSSGKIRPAPAKADSDVRLVQSGKVKKPTSDQNATTDEIELDILPQGSSSKLSGSGKISASSSSKLKSPSPSKPPSKSGKLPPPSVEPDSSEFELNLDADSSDEFELSLANDSSDEISLGDAPTPAPASDRKSGMASGINIGKPKDAGVSLEKKGDGRSSKKLPPVKAEDIAEAGKSSKKLASPKKPDSDEEIDFELSLDQPGASSKKKVASSKNLDSDSEFDLTLDDASDVVDLEAETTSVSGKGDEPKNDIFETDFEIPALDDDSASEAIAIDEADTDLESSSDFDLAIDEEPGEVQEDESGSQVVVLDDEIAEEEQPKARKSAKKKRAAAAVEEEDEAGVSFDDMELDESMSASRALKGLRKADTEEDEEQDTVSVVGGAPWGVWPGVVMAPTFVLVFVAGLMAYEMMHSMWGYHQPTAPSSIVVNGVADLLDMKPKDDSTK